MKAENIESKASYQNTSTSACLPSLFSHSPSSPTDIMSSCAHYYSAQTCHPTPRPISSTYCSRGTLIFGQELMALQKLTKWWKWILAVCFVCGEILSSCFFFFLTSKKSILVYICLPALLTYWNYTYIAHLKTLLCSVVWKNTMV